MLRNEKHITYVIVLKGYFLLMYFKIRGKSPMMVVVLMMMGTLVLISCSKLFTVGS